MTNFLCMGVLNLTPNSFSDGGLLENSIALHSQLQNFIQKKVSYYDIGAESTAPFNDPIDESQEKRRLELALKPLQENQSDLPFVSLDSYRPSTSFWFFKRLQDLGFPAHKFVWNDVSGVWDESVEEFLTMFPESRYVLCHNKAGSRDQASNHMDFADSKSDIFIDVIDFFKKINPGFNDRIIYDPCFGFSKTHDQNLALMNRMGELVASFPNNSWVFGISKKSFLRKLWLDSINPGLDSKRDKIELLARSELFHQFYLTKVMSECSGREIIFRVHDPDLFRFAQFLTAQ